jgi:hypothetical protein
VRPGTRGDGFFWARDVILYAIRLWARRHGRPPTANEWDRAGEDHPSRQTVQRVFGTWNTALQAAGFETRRPGQRRTPEVVEALDATG